MVATANELCATKWKSLVQNENKVKYFYWNDLLSLTLCTSEIYSLCEYFHLMHGRQRQLKNLKIFANFPFTCFFIQ